MDKVVEELKGVIAYRENFYKKRGTFVAPMLGTAVLIYDDILFLIYCFDRCVPELSSQHVHSSYGLLILTT